MGKKAIRPSLFRSNSAPKERMKQVAKALVNSTINAGAEAAKSAPKDVEVKVMPKYLQVTAKRLEKMGVLDLKPYFAKSPHKKTSKNGGWYLTVPIKRTARGMSRRMYEQLRAIDIAPAEQKTVISDYLYDRRRTSDSAMLNYKPKSNNIDKIRVRKNRHEYVAFRTVSNKSPANSWIVNRDRVNVNDTSKTFVRNVNKLMTWKMKNGWS